MRFWRSVAGAVEVELTSADPEAALEAFSMRNIEIWDLKKYSDLTCSFTISRKKYKEVREVCEKRGAVLKLCGRKGIYWAGKNLIHRPILLGGCLIILLLSIWVPSRVLFVQVEGNVRIPDKRIIAAAEDCGIGFGTSRRKVRSEQIKNALLSQLPELEWVGVNTSGCTAKISVREKNEAEEPKQRPNASSILAERDGYILSCTATAGNLLVKSGDSVRKGQVLISAYTDCGLCIRAEQAEGEILAQTSRKVSAVMLSESVKKDKQEAVKRKYSLLLRKKRIFLWKDSGIWEGSCGRMYEEYYITLPGGFRLPLALCVESYLFCQTSPTNISEEESDAALKSFAQKYLTKHMVAGKILSGVQTLNPETGRYRLEGEYACMEMIGTVRQEQIGDTNGKIG